MIPKDDIEAARARLAKAESERDAWRSSGMQEKYLEAYTRVEAFELQLAQIREQVLRAPADADERKRLMAEFDISYDGRQYRYGSYRYDRLADAAACARLRRAAGQLPA